MWKRRLPERDPLRTLRRELRERTEGLDLDGEFETASVARDREKPFSNSGIGVRRFA